MKNNKKNIDINKIEEIQYLKEIVEEVNMCEEGYDELASAYQEYVGEYGDLRSFLNDYNELIHFQSYLADKHHKKNFYEEIIIGRSDYGI